MGGEQIPLETLGGSKEEKRSCSVSTTCCRHQISLRELHIVADCERGTQGTVNCESLHPIFESGRVHTVPVFASRRLLVSYKLMSLIAYVCVQ